MIKDDELELLMPSEIYKEEISSFRQDFLDANDHMDGCGSLRKFENSVDYIENSILRANTETATSDIGGHAQQWICVRKADQRIVGMIQYRYEAEDEFKIGYSVRPSERRKGYAKWMLEQILLWCKDRDMKEVIIACESSNIASRNVILNCGGVYLETYLFKNIELEKYRIDLALNCPFCNIIKKQADAYVIYESENVIAFLDIDPINEGHVLIVPELHESSIDNMPIHILSEIMEVLQKVVTALKDVYHIEGYSIMQNGGEFCDFGHGHFHIFPRYKNDGFGWKYPEGSFECSQKVADQLKDAMSKTNANI